MYSYAPHYQSRGVHEEDHPRNNDAKVDGNVSMSAEEMLSKAALQPQPEEVNEAMKMWYARNADSATLRQRRPSNEIERADATTINVTNNNSLRRSARTTAAANTRTGSRKRSDRGNALPSNNGGTLCGGEDVTQDTMVGVSELDSYERWEFSEPDSETNTELSRSSSAHSSCNGYGDAAELDKLRSSFQMERLKTLAEAATRFSRRGKEDRDKRMSQPGTKMCSAGEIDRYAASKEPGHKGATEEEAGNDEILEQWASAKGNLYDNHEDIQDLGK